MRHDDFIRRYLSEVYAHRRLGMVGEFIGDPQIRHVGGATTSMTLAASTERIAGFFATYTTLDFTPVVLFEQDDMVTCVWNADLVTVAGEPSRFSSIEVFRIADSHIVEVWNAEASSAHWLP